MHKTTRVVVLSPGVDPEQYKAWRDDDGNTLLHLAAWEGDLKAVKFLIPKVDITIKNNIGDTAIHFAASIPNNSQVIEELAKELAKTREIDIKSNAGFTALHYSAKEGQTENLEALLKCGAKFTIPGYNGQTALHIATYADNTKNVEALLNYGADAIIPDKDGRTALHNATNLGKTEIVKSILLKEETSELVNKADNEENYTALHLASMKGNNTLVKDLIDFGADVDQGDKHGNTPLHLVTLLEFPSFVTTLIKSGANVNLQNDRRGDTALHIAISKGNIQLVTALMNENARVDIKNKKGETAIDIANKIEDESNRDTITGLLSGSNRIKIEGLLNPASESKRRLDADPGSEGPLKAARADKLDRSGAKSLG